MNFIQLIGSTDFELCTLAVATLCALTDFTLKKIKSVPVPLSNFVPIVIALLGTVIAELVACGKVDFSERLFYTAITAYSFGTVTSVCIRKLLRGEHAGDALSALVQGIAENICKEGSNAAYSKIAALLNAALQNESASGKDETLKQSVFTVLSSVKKDGVTVNEVSAVAELILQSAKQLKKEK